MLLRNKEHRIRLKRIWPLLDHGLSTVLPQLKNAPYEFTAKLADNHIIDNDKA